MSKKVLVTGAGGFIGHHLVSFLKDRGYWVRGVDIKNPEYDSSVADEFNLLDLRKWDACVEATKDVEVVYNLAADMGGIGYITAFLADIARNNTLINTLINDRISNLKIKYEYFYCWSYGLRKNHCWKNCGWRAIS